MQTPVGDAVFAGAVFPKAASPWSAYGGVAERRKPMQSKSTKAFLHVKNTASWFFRLLPPPF